MDRIQTDILVVGAGPAGTTVANLLAQHNIRVTIVDRSKFPRDKICGDALTLPAIKVLNDLELLPSVQDQFYPLTGSRLYSKEAIRRRNEQFHSLPFSGFAAPRLLLDQLLLEVAIEKGADFLPEVNIMTPRLDGNQVIGAVGKCNGKEISFQAKLTICADGSGGSFAGKLGLGGGRKKNPIAARAYYFGVKGMDHTVEFYYWKEFLPFYAWIFPVRDNITNIGVAMSVERNKNTHIQQVFENFIRDMSMLTNRFESAHPISKCEAFPLQTQFAPMRSFIPGALAAGDAAGLVHPTTGEGIASALESGVIVSRHVLRILQSGDMTYKSLQHYGIELAHRYLESYRLARVIKFCMRSPTVALHLVKLLQYT